MTPPELFVVILIALIVFSVLISAMTLALKFAIGITIIGMLIIGSFGFLFTGGAAFFFMAIAGYFLFKRAL